MDLKFENDSKKEKKTETEPFETFLNCQKVESLREGKSLEPKDIGRLLGVSKSTYLRIENKVKPDIQNKHHTFHYVEKFFKLAEILNIDPVDIVKPDCTFRKSLFTVSLLKFENLNDCNKHLFDYEEKYGRLIVFNTFPSTIYYLDNVEYSRKRYDFLGRTSLNEFEEINIRNIEYYTITSLLEFAINPFGRFGSEEKVGILTKMIDSFSRNIFGHERRVLRIFDPDAKDYYHDAPTCTIFRAIKTAFIPSPTNKNHLLAIRSDELVEDMTCYGQLDPNIAIDTAECIDLLKIVKSYVLDQDIHAFINRIDDETSKRVKTMVKKSLKKYAPGLLT